MKFARLQLLIFLPLLSAIALGVLRPEATSEVSTQETSPAEVGSPEALVRALQIRGEEVERLIIEGALASVWVPALAAKDIALRLELLAASEPEPKGAQVAEAVRELVLAAWLLDTYGDLGDRDKLTKIYRRFAAAIAQIAALHGKQ